MISADDGEEWGKIMPARLIRKLVKIYDAIEKNKRRIQTKIEQKRQNQNKDETPGKCDEKKSPDGKSELMGHQMAELIQERALHDELLRIIRDKKIQAVFQPIVNLSDASVMGYEALARGPADSPLHLPAQLFATAIKHKLLLALEHVCRESAIRDTKILAPGQQLFIEPHAGSDK